MCMSVRSSGSQGYNWVVYHPSPACYFGTIQLSTTE